MAKFYSRGLRWLLLAPLLAILMLAVSCGGDDATPAVIREEVEVTREVEKEVVVTKEVIREVEKEVVVTKEVIREVEKEVVVTKEVIREVEKEIIKQIAVTVTPVPFGQEKEFALIPAWVGKGKHYAGSLDFAYTSNLTRTWDPHQIRSWGRSMGGVSKQFNQLVENNPVGDTGEIIGDLAKAWKISVDGKVYTFTLHDALWWNGERVTAADVVFSMDRMTDPNATRGGTQPLTQFYAPGNSRVIDDQTVEITLKAPASGFIPRLASDYMKIYSKAVVEPQSDEDILCCPENNVGSGPWRIVDVKLGESIRYERNPLYFKTGRPYWDETEVFVIKDRSRLLTAYRTQQVVGLWSPHVGGRPPIDVLKVEEETNGKMRAKFAPAQALNLITLRTTQPPFDDPNLRKAFHLAIDRDKLITLMQSGFALPGTFLVPNIVEDIATLDQVPGWRRPKDQDLQEARALLAAAGYTDAKPLKGVLNGGNTASSVRMLEAVAATLRESVPIDLTPKPQDINANYDDAAKGTYLASAWTTGILIPDPADMIGSAIDVKTQRNPHDWTTPRITELIALQAAELDPDKRKAHLTEMVEIFRTGESHFVPLVWAFSEGILDHRMRNYHMCPTYHLCHKFDHVWWDPDHDPNEYEDYEILEKPFIP